MIFLNYHTFKCGKIKNVKETNRKKGNLLTWILGSGMKK